MEVEEISEQSDQQQAETIANSFEKISHEYEPLTKESISQETYATDNLLIVHPHQVYQIIKAMKTKSSTPLGDIPMKLIKEFGMEEDMVGGHGDNSGTSFNWHFSVKPISRVSVL